MKPRNKILKKYRDLIIKKQIIPYFQGIVCTKTKQIIKYECLARLIDEEGKVLTPGQFLPAVTKYKLESELTIQMIEKSFSYFVDKLDNKFSVNISFNDINNKNTRMFILQSIRNFPNATNITFEILEDSSIESIYEDNNTNSNKPKIFLNTIKKLGCKIALDDFGSGYSNFVNMVELDLDIIKIDGSLIKKISQKKVLHLLHSMVLFSKAYEIEIVAEFVENKQIAELVEYLEIDHSQGYLYSKPCDSI
jgi:EAL domain-containing protein (putative c-di-GMP-specific phosphodiesterase class I)